MSDIMIVQTAADQVVVITEQIGDTVDVQETFTSDVVVQETGPRGDVGPQGLPGTIVAVSPTPPSSPSIGQLWVDTS